MGFEDYKLWKKISIYYILYAIVVVTVLIVFEHKP